MHETDFSEAMRRKYPEWVVLVSTVDEDGTPDVMPAGWSMVASYQPPMFAVSVGHTRYTHELVRSRKEFVVAFPGPGLEEAIAYTGSCSGRDVKEKVANAGLAVFEASLVEPPLLEDCVVNLECELAGELEAGDHTIFLGRVVAAHVAPDVPGRLLNFAGEFAVAVPGEPKEG